ncbi:MAG: hypothetical protein H6767_04510 [Candidatus Peribacteria bacterium]|nr:MAG: hypothetical protein H6767_04510 [Candidatus Peribacteria bacterium]
MNTDEETSIPEATLPKEDKSMFFETKNEEKTIEEVPENKQDISDEDLDAVTRIEDSSVPDWLKNSVTTSTAKATPKSEPKDEAVVVPREKQQEAPKEVKKDTNNDVPDWLKGGFDIDKKTSESTQTNMASEKIERVKDDNSQKNIPTPSDEKIPSWLQGAAMSKGEEKPEAVVKDVEAQEVVTPEAKKEAVKESRSSSHDDVPDWLKGSFDPEPLKTEDKKEAAEKDDRVSEEPEKKEEVPAWLQGAAMSKGEEKPEAVVKDVEAQEVVTPEAKKEEVKETTSSSHDDVPDWLKGSFDPEPQEETKKDAPGSVDTEGATEIVNEDVEGESNATMTSSTDGVSEEAPKKKTRRRRR